MKDKNGFHTTFQKTISFDERPEPYYVAANYAMMSAEVRYNKRLSAQEKLVYLEMCATSGDIDLPTDALASIRFRLDISKEILDTCILSLIREGVISRTLDKFQFSYS